MLSTKKTKIKNNYICFVAGHSGGHIIPALTQAKNELRNNQNLKLIFFCTTNPLDKIILKNYEYIDTNIFLSINKIQKNPIKFLCFLIIIFLSFLKTLLVFLKKRPNKIVSTGGLVSIPVCLAGYILKIPIELWELNVLPGKAIKFLSLLATKINICFKETQKYFSKKNCNLVNYPLRYNNEVILDDQKHALKKIGLDQNYKTLLIIGGSQGSFFLNNLMRDFIQIKKNIQIIHQIGSDLFEWKKFYDSFNIKAITFSYYDKIEEFYLAADLIICRSGAGTLAEVIYFHKKCITFPLKTDTTNHQLVNANQLSKSHPNLIYVMDQNMDKSLIFDQINKLL